MVNEVTLEARLVAQMEDAIVRRDKATDDYETASGILERIIRGRFQDTFRTGAKSIHIVTSEVNFHGFILHHWPCTIEKPVGLMFVVEGMEKVWQVGRELDLMTAIQNSQEMTSYAVQYTLDSPERIRSVLHMLNDPARVSVRN